MRHYVVPFDQLPPGAEVHRAGVLFTCSAAGCRNVLYVPEAEQADEHPYNRWFYILDSHGWFVESPKYGDVWCSEIHAPTMFAQHPQPPRHQP